MSNEEKKPLISEPQIDVPEETSINQEEQDQSYQNPKYQTDQTYENPRKESTERTLVSYIPILLLVMGLILCLPSLIISFMVPFMTLILFLFPIIVHTANWLLHRGSKDKQTKNMAKWSSRVLFGILGYSGVCCCLGIVVWGCFLVFYVIILVVSIALPSVVTLS